ncbi:MAG: Rad52/Rad22 family DNA repair protein [Pyrinomonadaceae bacterium]
MTALAIENNSGERRDKRAKSIAAMGLVNREGDRFRVSTPSLRGKQTSYEVWRDETGKIRCNCLEYEENVIGDSTFRCEHIIAVKYSLLAKNTEGVTKQTTTENKISEEVVSNKQNATESSSDLGFENADSRLKNKSEIQNQKPKIGASEDGEQKPNEVRAGVSENGQSETKTTEPRSLANTKGNKKMLQENIKEMSFVTAGEAAAQNEEISNVVSGNFPSTLKQLRQNVDPHLVKSREGWRDRNGNVHMVDYVEWHTVADILDETAPNWQHAIRDIKQIGDVITVTVAITIDGVTREGIGTGLGESELGIKKAEHDALKRAAVKFGIARELYRKESDVIERDGAIQQQQQENGFPSNPVAKSLGDLVTAKQLGMIRALARENGIEADDECQMVMNCKTDELSKKAASSFIQHLQTAGQQAQEVPAQTPLRRVS